MPNTQTSKAVDILKAKELIGGSAKGIALIPDPITEYKRAAAGPATTITMQILIPQILLKLKQGHVRAIHEIRHGGDLDSGLPCEHALYDTRKKHATGMTVHLRH